jgi:hypothetical protein
MKSLRVEEGLMVNQCIKELLAQFQNFKYDRTANGKFCYRDGSMRSHSFVLPTTK